MSYETIGKSDEWYTPKWLFDAIGVEFDLDVSADLSNPHISTPAKQGISEDSLNKEWFGFVWMNPPFGGRNGLVPWLDKFIEHGNGIALTPDRTSAKWWADFARSCDAVFFIEGKVKFIDQYGNLGKQPTTGTTLFAKGEKAVNALRDSKLKGVLMLKDEEKSDG